jgi:cytoskeletal protein RodZ
MSRRGRGYTAGDDAVTARRTVKAKALEMSDAKNTSTPDAKVVNVAPMSSETWELIEHRLWMNIRKKLWTTVVAVLTISGIVGYVGIPNYIQSLFQNKIEEETKNFKKLHDEIARQQADIYTDERIFLPY